MAGAALDQALALQRSPQLRHLLQRRPLPDGLPEVIRLAAGREPALAAAAEALRVSPPQLLEAVRFYLQQLLFADHGDAYRTLGVRADATADEIRQHYRWLQNWLHPDRQRDEWNAVYAARLNQAWAQLRTAEAREQYDAARGAHAADLAASAAPVAWAPAAHAGVPAPAPPPVRRAQTWRPYALAAAALVAGAAWWWLAPDAAPDPVNVPTTAIEASPPSAAPAQVGEPAGSLQLALASGLRPPPLPPINPAPPEVDAAAPRAARRWRPRAETLALARIAPAALPTRPASIVAAPARRPAPAVAPAQVSAGDHRGADMPPRVQVAAAAAPAAPRTARRRAPDAASSPPAPILTPVALVEPAAGSAPAALFAAAATAPPADELSDAALFTRMQQARARLQRATNALQSARHPSAAPVGISPVERRAAGDLVQRLGMRAAMAVDLVEPQWRMSAHEASVRAGYVVSERRRVLERGELQATLTWQEDGWQPTTLELRPRQR